MKYQASESYHDWQQKTKRTDNGEANEHFSAWLLRRCVQDDDAHTLLEDKGKSLLDLLLAHEERLNQIDGQDVEFTQTTTRTGRAAIELYEIDDMHHEKQNLRRSMT